MSTTVNLKFMILSMLKKICLLRSGLYLEEDKYFELEFKNICSACFEEGIFGTFIEQSS